MSMFTRKTIEICFFIADCMAAATLIAAFFLEVRIPVFAEVALVCVPALCTGWAAMGGVRKRIRFLKSVSIYDKERVAINILTVAMIFFGSGFEKAHGCCNKYGPFCVECGYFFNFSVLSLCSGAAASICGLGGAEIRRMNECEV